MNSTISDSPSSFSQRYALAEKRLRSRRAKRLETLDELERVIQASKQVEKELVLASNKLVRDALAALDETETMVPKEIDRSCMLRM